MQQVEHLAMSGNPHTWATSGPEVKLHQEVDFRMRFLLATVWSVFPVVFLFFSWVFCFCILGTESLIVQAGLEFLILLPPSVWLARPHPAYFSEQLANEETRLLSKIIYSG